MSSARSSTESDALKALRLAYEQHAPWLRNLLRRLAGRDADVDDLLQEAFLTAWKRRDTFIEGAPMRPWLTGIAIRVAASARRRGKLRRFFGLETAPEPQDPWTPEGRVDALQEQRFVHSLLEKLSEKRRTVLVLYEIEGLSGAEIAEVVGCPLNTVWTRLHHARQDFLELLEASRADDLQRSAVARGTQS